MIRTAILLLMLLSFASYGCKKKAGLFAPEFFCKVDGEKFKPKKSDFKSSPLDIDFYDDTLILIRAVNSPKVVFIGVRDENGIGMRTYTLSEADYISNTSGVASFDDNLSTDEFKTSKTYTGEIEILNIDYDKKVLNAKFEYEAYNDVKKEKVKITDGKINAYFTQK